MKIAFLPILFGVALLAVPSPLRGQGTRDTVVVVAPAETLDLTGVVGTTTVEAWTGDSVEIRVEKVPAIRIEVKADASTVEVRTYRGARQALERTHVRIRMPADMGLHLVDQDNEVTVRGLRGTVEVWTQDASLLCEDVVGDITANVTRGDVTLLRSGGMITADLTTGDVRVEGGSGSLRAETVAGGVFVSAASFGKVHLTTNAGAISYSGDLLPDGSYDLASQSGNVTLTYPSTVAAALFEIGSVHGRVEVPPGIGDLTSTGGELVRLPLGSGTGPHVKIVTFRGDVRLRSGA